MFGVLVYFKGFHWINGERTNHLEIWINNLTDIDKQLKMNALEYKDVTTIDFRL